MDYKELFQLAQNKGCQSWDTLTDWELSSEGKYLEMCFIKKWLEDKYGLVVTVSPVFEFNHGRADYLACEGWDWRITAIEGGKYNQEKSKSSLVKFSSSEEALPNGIWEALKLITL